MKEIIASKSKADIEACHYSTDKKYTELLIMLLEEKDKKKDLKDLKDLIQFTLIHRISILQTNNTNLFKSSIKKEKTAYANDSIDISMNLNSFYFHLSGIIDNLGWYIEYKLKILNIEINDKRNKSLIGLYKNRNKKFLQELKIKEINLYNTILEYQNWFNELIEKRDPITHRKPLYVPPTVQTEKERKFMPIGLFGDSFINIVESTVEDTSKLHSLIIKILKYNKVI
jgi:hypothetical protein